MDVPVNVTPAVEVEQVAEETYLAPPSPKGRTVLIDATVSIAFSVYRPYIHPLQVDPLPTVTEVTTPLSVPADPSVPPISPTSVDEATEEDKLEDSVDSEDSVEVVKEPIPTTDEMEGVKKRWFREEMRQSAVLSSHSIKMLIPEP